VPRACSVCIHAERDAIDHALVKAAPMRRVAADHGLAETSVRRHAQSHLPSTLVLAAEAHEVTRADGLLAEARRLHGEAVAALEAAKATGNLGTVLQALDRTQKSVVLLSTLLARLPSAGQPDKIVITWQSPKCKQCGYDDYAPGNRNAAAGAVASR
jgi:hypothetical protein